MMFNIVVVALILMMSREKRSQASLKKSAGRDPAQAKI
jgi:hypothetical protein